MPDARQSHLVDDKFWVVWLETVKGCSAVGVHDEGRVLELAHVLVQPIFDSFRIQRLCRFEDGFQVLVCRQVSLKLCSSLYTFFRVVLWDELLFVS